MQTQLAARIVDLREKVNMSQSELAKRLGIDKSSMNKIEKSTRKVSSEELDKIASIFNVSTDYLLGRDPKEYDLNTADLADDDTIFTFEGKPIPEQDLEYMKRLLRGGRK
ncbi:helix-turn-helix transcriptional regulator [Limosilactobacillus fermentum]